VSLFDESYGESVWSAKVKKEKLQGSSDEADFLNKFGSPQSPAASPTPLSPSPSVDDSTAIQKLSSLTLQDQVCNFRAIQVERGVHVLIMY
jgi:hypothetical protein